MLTRGQLIDRVWGSDYVGDTKTLDVHVKRLRAKVEPDPANPKYLLTVRGLGYKLGGVRSSGRQAGTEVVRRPARLPAAPGAVDVRPAAGGTSTLIAMWVAWLTIDLIVRRSATSSSVLVTGQVIRNMGEACVAFRRPDRVAGVTTIASFLP